MLAHRIDFLELNKYLLMGKGDINKNEQNQDSVKEDLFEAIIGAVAIDSEYDMDKLYDVVISMLNPLQYIENGFELDVTNTSASIASIRIEQSSMQKLRELDNGYLIIDIVLSFVAPPPCPRSVLPPKSGLFLPFP